MSFFPQVAPDQKTFSVHYKSGKTQLAWMTIPGDLETPVGLFLKLCGEQPYSFLLESIEGGNVLGRYSIIGFAPDLIWTCKDKIVKTKSSQKDWEEAREDALFSLKSHIGACRIDVIPEDLPPMAVSGLFGYVGYDMIRLIENIPDNNPDHLKIPDSVLMRPTVLVIFDNVKQLITFVAPVYAHANNSTLDAQTVYKNTAGILHSSYKKLYQATAHSPKNKISALTLPLDVQSDTTRVQYHDAVKKAVAYTYEGDIFQVVPSQRFVTEFDQPAFSLYRALRRLNPSPFMFYIAFEGFQLVGASPEILVRVRDGEVTIRPIAGTRKRGTNAAEDKALAEDLLSDEKERAEHLMLLDLGRNDVGRVSEYGSVTVTDSFIVEKYSHVMHIVSNVTGKLRADHDIVDAFFAGFPAGTVSGAPKVRAMEIIDELEVSKRGFYAGGAGYFSGNGTLDTCISLRTGLVKDGKLYVQAGGGVVADSDPEFEYQETINKSKALIRAAELAVEASKIQGQP